MSIKIKVREKLNVSSVGIYLYGVPLGKGYFVIDEKKLLSHDNRLETHD